MNAIYAATQERFTQLIPNPLILQNTHHHITTSPHYHIQSLCCPIDITGKPMKGWLFVSAEGWDNAHRLENLVEQAREYVSTLPPK